MCGKVISPRKPFAQSGEILKR